MPLGHRSCISLTRQKPSHTMAGVESSLADDIGYGLYYTIGGVILLHMLAAVRIHVSMLISGACLADSTYPYASSRVLTLL